MKVKALTVSVVILAAGMGVFAAGRYFITRQGMVASKTAKDLYYCPMHPSFTSDKPGVCAICGMSLVKRVTASGAEQKTEPVKSKKILFYRNPMNPQVTSPVPMKDQMGMDYAPVYEEETAPAQTAGVYISPEKQQLIGVKKENVQIRKLSGQILTVGRVAYDPALFIAQQEYLQAFKSSRTINAADSGYIEEQSKSFIKVIKQKLLAMGMSEAEIDELEKQGRPQQNLYLPGSEDKNVWVYVTIYEYEAGLVKTGTRVEIRAIAYPGEVFEGSVISVMPILESATRTVKARALVDNPDNKLKLEMFVNATIKYDLGEKLAVPEDAVMHAGTRDIVFVAKPDAHFEPRVVTLGAKAEHYYEVLRGLAENEEVVTSGNFLVDSESKLNAVLNQAAEPNR
jgi:multidrug efflux pump subunit AcrA (membrane-fusion protein)